MELYRVFCAGLKVSGHPLGNILSLGPTGVGKTQVVEATAEILFEGEQALIKVDCAEFQHSPEISKLIGSLPAILVVTEHSPLITQEALADVATPDPLPPFGQCPHRVKQYSQMKGSF